MAGLNGGHMTYVLNRAIFAFNSLFPIFAFNTLTICDNDAAGSATVVMLHELKHLDLVKCRLTQRLIRPMHTEITWPPF